MLTTVQWDGVANHIRSKLDNYYDPALGFVEDKELRQQLSLKHKGAYIGFEYEDVIVREGFLKEDLTNILESFDRIVDQVYGIFKKSSVPATKLHVGTFHYVIITEVTYLPNPDQWNENRDGIYFMWGQDYRGLYLPYEIQKMNMNKIDVMDRLCSHQIGVPANLWRLPEGLVHLLTCHYHKS